METQSSNKSPPDASDVAGCTYANLRKASRAVGQVYDAALQRSGLKATQFTLLATLNARGDMPLSQLADVLVMDRTTLTRNLKLLVAKDLIHIAPVAPSRGDGRSADRSTPRRSSRAPGTSH